MSASHKRISFFTGDDYMIGQQCLLSNYEMRGGIKLQFKSPSHNSFGQFTENCSSKSTICLNYIQIYNLSSRFFLSRSTFNVLKNSLLIYCTTALFPLLLHML